MVSSSSIRNYVKALLHYHQGKALFQGIIFSERKKCTYLAVSSGGSICRMEMTRGNAYVVSVLNLPCNPVNEFQTVTHSLEEACLNQLGHTKVLWDGVCFPACTSQRPRCRTFSGHLIAAQDWLDRCHACRSPGFTSESPYQFSQGL